MPRRERASPTQGAIRVRKELRIGPRRVKAASPGGLKKKETLI